MLQTKNVNNWPCSLQNEVKNVKLLTNDDWWRPMEIDHPSDAEELIFWMIKFLCSLNSFWSSLKFEQNAIKMSLPETYHNTKHMYKSNTKLVIQLTITSQYIHIYKSYTARSLWSSRDPHWAVLRFILLNSADTVLGTVSDSWWRTE